ncbi:glycosyltransferase family 2 protein [Pectinatus frisingensis]|uniref:glycosyltransferase family 2 protein n=1 Tax=Pectinatus frisingensis TaxID=865 RepID=UPI0018C6B9CE|nr:glycosyltransferase family 2 protein [Pectinatus frisingensis]
MKISACVIVKNEADNLQTWLTCMQKIADEFIIVDTGSTDDTKQAAFRGGANVYDFIWKDDFAAAKNYAISKAKGDWILFFDADEYFSAMVAMKMREQLNAFLYNNNIDGFLCKLINIDKDKDNQVLSSFYQLRIFRNKLGITYEGAIHEELRNNGKSMRLVALSADIYAYHTGYSSSINNLKLKRNLDLLKKQIYLNGERPEFYPYLATCYFGLQDYEKAANYLQKFIDSGINMLGAEVYVYLQYIDALKLAGHSHDEIVQALEKALQKFPVSADFNYKKGIMLFEENKFISAEKYLNKALRFYNDDGQLSASKMEAYLFMLYGILAEINVLKKDSMLAVRYYIKSLQENHYSQFLVEFYQMIKTYPVLVRIKLLDKIYQHSGRDLEFLLQCLEKFDDGMVLLHYKKFVSDQGVKQNKYLQLFLNKKYNDLIHWTTGTLDAVYRQMLLSTLQTNKVLPEKINLVLPSGYQKAFYHIRSKLM